MAKKSDQNGQDSMFDLKEGHAKEEEKKEKKPLEYERFGYDRSDVVSAFIKEMRLGKVEDALYWLTIMRKANEPKNYVVRRLVAFAGEDAFGPEALAVASDLVTAFNWEPGYDWNILETATVYLTQMSKWWTTETGVLWKKSQMRNERLIKLGKFKPVPRYAMDFHCKAGWALKDAGETIENRMSGDGNGIAKRIDSYEKFGEFRWVKLRGWDWYVKEEFDDSTGDWKKAKPKEENYQPPPPPDPKQPKEGYEPAIEYDLEKKVFKVQSESDLTKFYEVDLINGHCTCPYHQKTGAFCKHQVAAKHWTPF